MNQLPLPLAALLVILVAARAEELDSHPRLRDLPQVTVSASASFKYVRGQGWHVIWGTGDTAKILQALRARVTAVPDDPEARLALAEWLHTEGSHEESVGQFAEAEKIYRQRLEKNPTDPDTLVGLANCLHGTETREESEKILRPVVRDAPQNWWAWLALGETLSDRVAWRMKDSPNQNKEAEEKLLEEAEASFDKAVAAAPMEPEVYAARARFRMIGGMLSAQRNPRGEEPKAVAYFPKSMRADMLKAADLQPTEFEPIAAWALAETTAALQTGDEPQREEILTRLAPFAKGDDDGIVARAECVIAMLALFQQDTAAMEKGLRRAVALDPTLDVAWYGLIGVYAGKERWDKMLETCRRRLQHGENTRFRYMLVKIYVKLERYADAEKELDAALKLDPNLLNPPK